MAEKLKIYSTDDGGCVDGAGNDCEWTNAPRDGHFHCSVCGIDMQCGWFCDGKHYCESCVEPGEDEE